MPPKPLWADDKPDLTEGSIGWSHPVRDEGVGFSVGIARRDWIDSDAITVGNVVVYVEAEDNDMTPAKARAFAALLIEAALAER